MDNVLAHCLQGGYKQAVVMDSDSPSLPAAILEQAFRELEDPEVDVVLGPCEDGGYYLIGIKASYPALFQGIAWSTESVVPQTLGLCHSLGLAVHKLQVWYDVDVEADLSLLFSDATGDPALAPCTLAFLRDHGWTRAV